MVVQSHNEMQPDVTLRCSWFSMTLFAFTKHGGPLSDASWALVAIHVSCIEWKLQDEPVFWKCTTHIPRHENIAPIISWTWRTLTTKRSISLFCHNPQTRPLRRHSGFWIMSFNHRSHSSLLIDGVDNFNLGWMLGFILWRVVISDAENHNVRDNEISSDAP